MSLKLVIVGGVAGGASAAVRARRLDERATIVLVERGEEVSFANCGLPYHIGGEISSREALLVQTKAGLSSSFALDVRIRTSAVKINRETKTLHLQDLESGRCYEESYDILLLSPGAAPFVPSIEGSDHSSVFTLRSMNDMDRIKSKVDSGAKTAIVIGGGFIGVEAAENLVRRGIKVALVELLPQVMPGLDPEIAAELHRELANNGVELYLGNSVAAFEDAGGALRARLTSGADLHADFAIVAAGVRPESRLAGDAGLKLNDRGAIIVDDRMRTSDASIYAVGDAVQVKDSVLGIPMSVPLAGPANRQARVAADNICGRDSRYQGAQGTSIIRVFGLTAASSGWSEAGLKRRKIPYNKIYVHRGQHVQYFPGAVTVTLKLLFAPEDGRILGAQAIGADGVDKRIDVLAAAIYAGLTVFDLEDLELAYAPQFGAAKDPVNIAGYVAANLLLGDEDFIYAEDLAARDSETLAIFDVREKVEFEAGHIPGARSLPLSRLRQCLNEIPKDKQVVLYCGVGQRSYYAARVLRQHGFSPLNLAGGFTTYKATHYVPPSPDPGAYRSLVASRRKKA